MKWSVVLEKAINPDGSVFFPEKFTLESLKNIRRTQGSYIFANQYMNEIVPDEDKRFKKEWFRYFDPSDLPDQLHHFGFIDPAISRADGSDWTALVIVSIDTEGTWYVRLAQRAKLSPSQIVTLAFNAVDKWNLNVIGIEDIAYQRALLYMIIDEGKRRGRTLPAQGIGLGDHRHKDSRILGLVPRFEWSRIYMARGLYDLENELNFFPRGSKDVVDALARIEQIAYSPTRKRVTHVPHHQDANYESHYIRKLAKRNASDG